MLTRLLCSAMFALCACAPAYAWIPINPEAQALVDAAAQLRAQGKIKASIEALLKAAKADPTSSLPLSMLASTLTDVAANASGDARTRLSAQATAAAREALSRNPTDPVAQELLRSSLDEDAPDPLHRPSPAAGDAMAEGESLFQQKRYSEALVKYEAAAGLDPLYSLAWVFAGDCFYAQRQWPEAEQRFRKAAQLEPLNGQAWRYLSDALFEQGKHREAEQALFSAIAAHPSQLPNWEKLSMHMGASGLALKRFVFVRKAAIRVDKAGKPTIELQQDFGGDGADGVFWTSYGMGLAQAKLADPHMSAYALELAGLRTALQIDRELVASKGERQFADPALTALRKLDAEGQLAAALLLLMYRESYRAELEQWKRAHPEGVHAFVATYGLRP
jgi:tetratricopeptide (TPR) repeat protein